MAELACVELERLLHEALERTPRPVQVELFDCARAGELPPVEPIYCSDHRQSATYVLSAPRLPGVAECRVCRWRSAARAGWAQKAKYSGSEKSATKPSHACRAGRKNDQGRLAERAAPDRPKKTQLMNHRTGQPADTSSRYYPSAARYQHASRLKLAKLLNLRRLSERSRFH